MKIAIKPANILTMGFALFLISIVLISSKSLPVTHLLMIYLSIILLQIIPVNSGIMKDIMIPGISILAIFESLENVVWNINGRDLDYILIRIDYLLTSTYPTLVFEKIATPLLTDIMQLAYTTYYFIPLSLGIFLKIHRNEEGFQRSLFIILFCFYLSYLGYLIIPALGPRYTISHLHENTELHGLFIKDHIYELLNRLEGIKRDAFPSGHVAIALITLFLSMEYEKGLSKILFPLVILLMVSTIYLRYHYLIDVIGGIILAIISILGGSYIYRNIKKRDEKEDPHN